MGAAVKVIAGLAAMLAVAAMLQSLFSDARMGRCVSEGMSYSRCVAYFDEMDARHQYDD